MNASTSKSANGTEVYYSSSNNDKNRAGLSSSRLATLLVNNLSTVLGTSKRGTNTAKFVVVHRNTVPAVLIELGFMSNQNDFNKISNASYQETVAKTIYETLCDVFDQYPTGR
jgi:N-acetylmuramoyl-L-alanine amidase